LKNFKEEMKPQGLYHEYESVEQFERDLYRHLERKIEECISGKLPAPQINDEEPEKKNGNGNHFVDSKTQKLIDFGDTLESISEGFSKEMAKFEALNGGGPDKYINLATHVYRSVAICIDRYLVFHGDKLHLIHKEPLESLNFKIKKLASSAREYAQKPFPQIFKEGRILSDNLSTHVSFMNSNNSNPIF
jgi:hypothetical protein